VAAVRVHRVGARRSAGLPDDDEGVTHPQVRPTEFYEAVLQVPFSSGHPGAWRTGQTRPPLAIMSLERGLSPVQPG
jgi:hypothetical protein